MPEFWGQAEAWRPVPAEGGSGVPCGKVCLEPTVPGPTERKVPWTRQLKPVCRLGEKTGLLQGIPWRAGARKEGGAAGVLGAKEHLRVLGVSG